MEPQPGDSIELMNHLRCDEQHEVETVRETIWPDDPDGQVVYRIVDNHGDEMLVIANGSNWQETES